MSFELPVIEDTPQVRMPLKVDTVLVEGFPLPPVGRIPQVGGRRNACFRVSNRGAYLHQLVLFPVPQGMHNRETCGLLHRIFKIIHCGHVKQQTVLQFRVVLQAGKRRLKLFRLHREHHCVQIGRARHIRKRGLDKF